MPDISDTSEAATYARTLEKIYENTIVSGTRPSNRKNDFALLKALIVFSWKELLISGMLYMVNVGATLVTPVIIFQLLIWAEEDEVDVGRGSGYIVALAASIIIGFFAEKTSEYYSREGGIKVRAALSTLIFERILREPTFSSRAVHSGEVLNLYGIDSLSILELMHGMLTLLLQPLEILGIVGLLYNYVQEGAFGGFGVAIVILAIAFIGANRVEKIQDVRSKLSDDRVRDVNEMLTGIRVIKLNGWEDKFAEKIVHARSEERRHFLRAGWHLTYVNPVSSNGIDVISLVVLLVYVYGLGNEVSPGVVFTYWVLLGMLHGKIFHYPVSLQSCRVGISATKRLHQFFSRELPPEKRNVSAEKCTTTSSPPSTDHTVPANASTATTNASAVVVHQSKNPVAYPSASPTVVLKNATVSWEVTRHGLDKYLGEKRNDASEKQHPLAASALSSALLTDVSLDIPAGTLSVVVGPVGSGKSSFISALLGEMNLLQGSISIEFPTSTEGASDRVSYVPQSSWVVQDTLRNNILFGNEFSADWYHAVTEATCLDDDFLGWPEGDTKAVTHTNLSGGQKQRVSIGRGLYAKPSLFILDDCISALDSRVGNHVYKNILDSETGVAGNSTRIVITNSATVILPADNIILFVPHRVAHAYNASRKTTPATTNTSTTNTATTPDTTTPDTADLTGVPGTTHAFSPVFVPGVQGVPGSAYTQASSDPILGPYLAQVITSGSGSVDDASAEGSNEGSHEGSAANTPVAASTPQATPSRTPVASVPGGTASASSEHRTNTANDASDSTPNKNKKGMGASPTKPNAANAELLAKIVPPEYQRPKTENYSIPFIHSWFLGAGGWVYSILAILLMVGEVGAVEGSIFILQYWTEDPKSEVNSLGEWFLYYSLFIILEFICAILRQQVYCRGTSKSASALHDALVFRVAHAPQAYFDMGNNTGELIDMFSHSIDFIDTESWYASEYFWLGLAYGLGTVIAQVTVTPFALIPGGVVIILLYLMTTHDSRKKKLANRSTTWYGKLWAMLTAPCTSSRRRALAPSNNSDAAGAAAVTAATLSNPMLESNRVHRASSVSAPRRSSRTSSISQVALDTATAAQSTVSSYQATDSTESDDKAHLSDCTQLLAEETVSLGDPKSTSNELYRQESLAKAPLFTLLNEAIDGCASIRVYKASDRFIRMHNAALDKHSKTLRNVSVGQWKESIIANLIGAVYYVFSTALVVPLRVSDVGTLRNDRMTSSEAGFIVTNSCFSAYMAQMVIQQAGKLQSLSLVRGRIIDCIMGIPQEVSVSDGSAAQHRAKEIEDALQPYYKTLKPVQPAADKLQAPRIKVHQAATAPPENWPDKGVVEFRNICMRYSSIGSLVLKGFSLSIPAGTHVSIVGRTGAGKSSLVASIIRLVEISGGSILIDGTDLATLRLGDVRRRIGVISQDPLFFTGSLRKNIDPFEEHSDEELEDALKQVGLWTFFETLYESQIAQKSAESDTDEKKRHNKASPTSSTDLESAHAAKKDNAPTLKSPLDLPIAEKGSNLSIGQQQLLAVVRVLLRRPRILLLDEATASLDITSEQHILETVRKVFANSTVISIAHRLAAVVQSHKVAVMAYGQLVEFGSPKELLTSQKLVGVQELTKLQDSMANRHLNGKDVTQIAIDYANATTVDQEFKQPLFTPTLVTGHFRSMIDSLPKKQKERLISQAIAADF